ncbi:MAG TPA: terminase [Gemmobacter sp.]|nr:terminase [Gemmobacter sp.]
MNWSTACPDWERRIIAGESLVPCPPLFPDYAEFALSIFKQLKIYDVPGQPTMGEACREWVFDFVRAIFGAYDQDAGRRLITEFLLHISKKNTKSTIAAGLMLTAAIINWRDGAEFLILAPTIEVAGNSYVPARWMIKLDDDLSTLFHVQDHLRTITHRENGTVLKVVAADKDTVSGKKATGVLVDELWLFGERANAENMLAEATGGLASRPEGFVVYLTTQSDKPPAGVFLKKLVYGRNVRDGQVQDQAFMPILYEFPEQMVKDEAYRLPENFYITNPNLGLSVDIPFLERKARIAEEDGEESLQGFRAKHLNVQVGTVLRSQRWTGADYWDDCDAGVTLDDIIERSEVIVAGVDGGGLDDLLGFAVIGREQETGDWLLWNKAWCDPVALERRKSEAPRYRDFAGDGDLSIVPLGQDVEELCEIIGKLEESGLLDRVGVDPLGLGGIVDGIVELSIEHDRVVGVSQGYRLSGAIQTTARKAAEGTLKHGGQSLMSWCVGNARVEKKGNADIVTKQASGTGKIDPLVATFCAVALMALNPEARGGRSIYETRGILTI